MEPTSLRVSNFFGKERRKGVFCSNTKIRKAPHGLMKSTEFQRLRGHRIRTLAKCSPWQLFRHQMTRMHADFIDVSPRHRRQKMRNKTKSPGVNPRILFPSLFRHSTSTYRLQSQINAANQFHSLTFGDNASAICHRAIQSAYNVDLVFNFCSQLYFY